MSSRTSAKVWRGLAKALGIKLHERDPYYSALAVTRGESAYSVATADSYVEEEATTLDWFKDVLPTGPGLLRYTYSLFPFTHWITRYNEQWLIADLVAGITVGFVVVPQGMAYARLAALPVQFGLYSSFMGVLIYWFFATSKDITIGPVAVMSTIVGNIVLRVRETHPDLPGHVVASALAIVAGAIISIMGLARCGWIVDFISLTAISAFMTGSAINIAVGQVPHLLGITGFDTRAATYKVAIDILKNLGSAKVDAVLGLTALSLLYFYRFLCGYLARRIPRQQKTFFFISTLRTTSVILLFTMISWLVNRNHRSHPRFSIIQTVPRGFQNAAVPRIDLDIIRTFTSELPATVIVLLVEHIAISKSFGRINNYTIDPSQELIAIGITNLLGPFLGAYPATGSFSRTAIKSKAGVRTPFAGVVTAILVILAIYILPAVFFYIPNAGLSAVIIHAVGDLITPPKTIYQFWRVSPLEVIIFFAGVFATVFATIETGVYVTVCLSVAVLLLRVVKAQGRFLGRVPIHSVIGDHVSAFSDQAQNYGTTQKPAAANLDPDSHPRNIFLPINHDDGTNPDIEIASPHPGIFIYRFSEGFNYPNANHYLDHMTATIFQETRRTHNPDRFTRPGDRPWNRRSDPDHRHLPTLKALILDFSSVNHVDITSVQNLIDVRNQLDRYAAPHPVQWHFACIHNRWTKRALASAGFGYPTLVSGDQFRRWTPIFSVVEIEGSESANGSSGHGNGNGNGNGNAQAGLDSRGEKQRPELRRLLTADDLEKGRRDSASSSSSSSSSSSTQIATVTVTVPVPVTDGSQRADDGIGTDGFGRREIGVVPQQKQLARSSSSSSSSSSNNKGCRKGTERKRRVAVVQGLDRPLFHVDLAVAVQCAVANVGVGVNVNANVNVEGMVG